MRVTASRRGKGECLPEGLPPGLRGGGNNSVDDGGEVPDGLQVGAFVDIKRNMPKHKAKDGLIMEPLHRTYNNMEPLKLSKMSPEMEPSKEP
jgi:hypothetical protein